MTRVQKYIAVFWAICLVAMVVMINVGNWVALAWVIVAFLMSISHFIDQEIIKLLWEQSRPWEGSHEL